MSIKCQHAVINENCQSCKEIKEQWYEKLKKKGFQDIEERNFNLLKKWTGVSNLFDITSSYQEENSEIKSNWPETNFKKEEELLNHPDFGTICESIFKHKNNRINSKNILLIWRSHCDGFSNREIGKKYNIFYVTVFRAIRRLEELVKIMDLEPNEKHVIIRPYQPESDAPLLFSTWRRSVWFDNHTDNQIDPLFFRLKNKQIKLILENPYANVKVACLNDDYDQIVGYSVMIGSVIEFVYVKLDYRKQGIAKLLTRGFIFVAEPTTKIGKSIVKRHNLRIQGEKNDESDDSRRTKEI